jgi:hypothetical protein
MRELVADKQAVVSWLGVRPGNQPLGLDQRIRLVKEVTWTIGSQAES